MNPFHSCRSSSDSAPCGRLPCSCVLACRVCCCIFSGLLFVTSGSAVIDYEIQRRAFGRHTSPLARYLTTIDFLGPCLCCCIKSALSSPWYKALLTTVSLFFSRSILPNFSLVRLVSLACPLLSLAPSLLLPLYRGSICALPQCYVLCIKSSLSLTPAVDRSEDRETRCNAIFSFVFTGGIFYHEDEFLRGDGSQGKYHHGVLFLANGVSRRETPLCLQAEWEAQHKTNTVVNKFVYFLKLQALNRKLNIIYARCLLDKKHVITLISNPGKIK